MFCVREIRQKINGRIRCSSTQPFVDFTKEYEVLCDNLTEFCGLLRWVRSIKLCLIEAYIKFRIIKYLPQNFVVKWSEKKEMFYWHYFQLCFKEMSLGRSKKTGSD